MPTMAILEYTLVWPCAYLISELSFNNPFLGQFTHQILILFARQFWMGELTEHTHFNFTQWTLEHLVYVCSETPTRTLWGSTVERFSASTGILRCLMERRGLILLSSSVVEGQTEKYFSLKKVAGLI